QIKQDTGASIIRWLTRPGQTLDRHHSIMLQYEYQPPRTYITLDRIQYKPFVYEDKPMRCNTCQMYGHNTKTCKAHKIICSRCAENHKFTECPNMDKKPQCINCKGPHSAAFTGCSKYREINTTLRI